MKKSILLIAALAMLGVATAVAQPRAIGGQLGYLLEASYEHSLGDNFLEADLGFPGLFLSGFAMETVVTYNWLNPFGADFPQVSKGDWNWYMGPGLGLGFGILDRRYNFSGVEERIQSHSFYFGAAGRFGVEYNFWFPLQLSAEWRPVVGPAFGGYKETNVNTGAVIDERSVVGFNVTSLYATAFVLGVRYKF